MDATWTNAGTEERPRFEHIHPDGTRHRSDRTIPLLNDDVPRMWRARVLCRQCRADFELLWPAEE